MRYQLAIGALVASLTNLALAWTENEAASVFPRQSQTCPDTYNKCEGIGSPFSMCCPPDSECIALANNTTKLCCPKDFPGGCSVFRPFSCEMQQQNSTSFPKSVVSTSFLDGELRRCDRADGSIGCCPFGYGCDSALAGGLGACRRLVDQGPNWDPDGEMEPVPRDASTAIESPTKSQSQVPSTSFEEVLSTRTSDGSTETIVSSQPVEPTGLAATTTGADSETDTGDAAPVETGELEVELPDTTQEESQETKDDGPRFPPEAILIGLFPGLAAGILLALGVMCLLGARRRKAPKISSPTLIGGSGNIRSDFAHSYQPSEQSHSKEQQPSPPPTAMGRVKSLFRKSNASAARNYTQQGPRGLGLGLPISPAPIRPQHQQHPPMPELKREPSGESINVFVDSNGLDSRQSPMKQWDTPGTTFTDMMDRADLSDVGKNGYVLPRNHERASGMKLSPQVYTPQGSPAGSVGRAGGRRLV